MWLSGGAWIGLALSDPGFDPQYHNKTKQHHIVTPKAQATKEKIDKLDIITITIFKG
jgi:hypothetical protein